MFYSFGEDWLSTFGAQEESSTRRPKECIEPKFFYYSLDGGNIRLVPCFFNGKGTRIFRF